MHSYQPYFGRAIEAHCPDRATAILFAMDKQYGRIATWPASVRVNRERRAWAAASWSACGIRKLYHKPHYARYASVRCAAGGRTAGFAGL